MNDFNSGQISSPQANELELSVTENPTGQVSFDKTTSTSVESSEQTLRRVLSGYEIGFKLKQLRLKKKIALVDLGKHTGLSASMLSQLENGKLIPTLPTLARIAMVFDVGLDFFFSLKRDRRTFAIVRAKERLRFPDRLDNETPAYFFEVLDFGITDRSMSAYRATFPLRAAQQVREHVHDGSEFVHVITGLLGINYQSQDYVLGPGDSVYFDASEPHCYFGQSDEPAQAIVVTTPPRL